MSLARPNNLYAGVLPAPSRSSVPARRNGMTTLSAADLYARTHADEIQRAYAQAPVLGSDLEADWNAAGPESVQQAAVTSNATQRNGAGMVLNGTLVDLRCYGTDRRNYAADHVAPDGTALPACGRHGAAAGCPVGLLVDGLPGNRAYVLLAPSARLAPHMGRAVRVHGRPAGPDIAAGAALLVDTLQVQQPTGTFLAVDL